MNNVTVYSTTTCSYCVMLKNFLDAQRIQYKDVNVQQDPLAMQYVMNQTGQMGVPQTKVNDEWVLGFDPEKIMSLMN